MSNSVHLPLIFIASAERERRNEYSSVVSLHRFSYTKTIDKIVC